MTAHPYPFPSCRRAGARGRRGWPPRGPARRRVEPPRGAVHRDAAAGRRHRLLHVPQLRARAATATSRIVANYLPLQDPYGGPNYFKLDPERRLRDPRQQRRRRASRTSRSSSGSRRPATTTQLNVGGKMVSIPLVQNGSGRRQRAQLVGAQRRTRTTRSASSAARAAAARRSRSPTPPRAARRSTSRSTTSAPRRSRNYVAYANQHIYDDRHPRLRGTGRVFVGQRKDPFVVNLGETFDLVNIKYPAVGAESARRVRDRRLAGRQERDVARARSADRLPDRRQGRRSSAAGPRPACRRTRTRERHAAAAASIRRRRPAASCRCRASACRSSTKS